MFYFDNILGNKVLKSDKLDSVEAFFTTRDSLIKSKDDSMNTLVEKNKQIYCEYFNILRENLLSPKQTHSANIEVADINKKDYPETDGLIVKDKNIAIFLNFADCTPIILYDKKQNIGAISHAGWRGTAQKISALTVEKLQKEFNTNPKDIVAVVGPAVSSCCYNVGEEVYNKLRTTVTSYNNLFIKKDDKLFVDLKGINKQQLIECGVEEIDVCPFCTCCDNEYFYSYRKENATTNRHSAILKLK